MFPQLQLLIFTQQLNSLTSKTLKQSVYTVTHFPSHCIRSHTTDVNGLYCFLCNSLSDNETQVYAVNCSFITTQSVSAASRCSSPERKQVPQPLWFMQHNTLTTGIQIPCADFEFLKTICVCENVKMCVHWEVREWQRGSSLAPAFLSAAVGRAISADSGWYVAGAQGLRGF